MAISPQDCVRAAEHAEEFLRITGGVPGRYRDDGSPKTFDEIESAAGLVADLVASMAVNEAAVGTEVRSLPKMQSGRSRTRSRL